MAVTTNLDQAVIGFVAKLRAQFLATGNPLFAWEALSWIGKMDTPMAVPDWVFGYLAGASAELIDAAQDIKPADFPGYVSAAIGLTRQGTGALAEWRILNGAEKLVGTYELEMRLHKERRSSGQRLPGRSISPSEHAELTIADQLGIAQISARRRIIKARKYLKAAAEIQGKALDLDALVERARFLLDFEVQLAEAEAAGQFKRSGPRRAKERRAAKATSRSKPLPKLGSYKTSR